MPNLNQEKGFTPLFVVLIVGLVSLLFVSSVIPIGKTFNDGKSSVAGVYLAKGDDGGSSDSPEKIKSEIRQGNLRVKFEIENGKIKIETKIKENENENETELEDEAEDEAVKEVEKKLEKEDIKIATAPGQMALVNKRVGALSNFPISIDSTTRQLTVTTPAGSKVVAVLPQKAIDNMLASRVMDDVIGERVDNNLASIPDLVKLETENGILGYKVRGTKTHKLLGFIPIKTKVEAFVSAENGQVVESKQSLLGRILNRIAP